MKENEFENMSKLLKSHYGATKVEVDNNMLMVHGTDPEKAYVAARVEYGEVYDITYDVVYEAEDISKYYCRILFLKKDNKVVDKV